MANFYKLIATCPEELVDTVATEIEKFGASSIQKRYKAVHFEVDNLYDYYAAHLWLRTPSRLLRVIKELPAKNFDELKNSARGIVWEKWFNPERTFRVEGVPAHRGAELMNANQISRAIREAIQERARTKNKPIPKVDLKDPKIELVAFVEYGKCVLSVDSSGKTMHKRGYRDDHHPAPIKETLAAGILQLIGYDGSTILYDPMCGSGTIVIEGAEVALTKAPLIHRKKGEFGFEWLADFDNAIWREVQEDARKKRLEEPPQKIFAADIEAKYVNNARSNALRARVEKHIDFAVRDFFKADAPASEGMLITNLPYGERIKTENQNLQQFYKDFGDTLKQKYAGWQAWVLAAEESPYKFIGLRPSRKISLQNGSVKVKLLRFDLYSGSKRR